MSSSTATIFYSPSGHHNSPTANRILLRYGSRVHVGRLAPHPPHASSATTTTFSIHHHRNVLLSNCQSFVPRLVSRLQSTVSQPPVILQSTTRYLGWSNAAAPASELTHNSISMEWKIIMRMRRIAAATQFQFIFYDLPCITNSISLLADGYLSSGLT